LFLETSVVQFHVEEEATVTVTYTEEEEERRRTEAKRLECEERLKRIRYFNDPQHLPLMVPASAKYIGVNQQSRIVLEIDVPSDDRLQVDICSFSRRLLLRLLHAFVHFLYALVAVQPNVRDDEDARVGKF
jgi:hypothetical protein